MTKFAVLVALNLRSCAVNILFLAHRTPYPPNKGEKIRTFHQIKHLANQGHHIHVCTPTETSEDIIHLKTLEQKYCKSIHHSPLKPGLFKIARLTFGMLKHHPLSIAHFYSKKLQVTFDHILKTLSIDIILCTSSSMFEYILRSTLLPTQLTTKPKLWVDFMDLDSDKWHQFAAKTKPPMKWIYTREAALLQQYEQTIHHACDACFFISKTEVELFSQQTPNRNKIHVIANGLDTHFFTPSPPKAITNKPIFLFTGVMDYYPNVDAVLWFAQETWPKLLNKWPNASFIIAGMQPTAKIRSLAKIKGISVTGYVNDILKYYHQADIFVAPFRLARGVQNKILQAFATGLPVVTTSIGAEGIECTDKTHLLIANNEQETLESIDMLLSNQTLRNRIRNNALNFVHQHFSWSNQLQALDKLLQKPNTNASKKDTLPP